MCVLFITCHRAEIDLTGRKFPPPFLKSVTEPISGHFNPLHVSYLCKVQFNIFLSSTSMILFHLNFPA